MKLARVSWAGAVFVAAPIMQLANGNWQMEARQRHARFDAGHLIEVAPSEIVEKFEAEDPGAQPQPELVGWEEEQ